MDIICSRLIAIRRSIGVIPGVAFAVDVAVDIDVVVDVPLCAAADEVESSACEDGPEQGLLIAASM